MGVVGGTNCNRELLVMLFAAVPLVLATTSLVSGQLPDHLKALCPAYPNCDNALLAAYDKIYQESLAPAGAPQAPLATSAELPCANYPFCDVNHAALAQGLPCANFPNCDVHHVAIAQRGKREAPAAVPLTPGNIPGLVPGSAAAAQWWAAQIAHQGQLAHHVTKREAPAATPLTPGNIPGLFPGSAAAPQRRIDLIAQLLDPQKLQLASCAPTNGACTSNAIFG